MKNNYGLGDVAEVVAFVMSQENILSVPPVLIPTDGISSPRKRPRKEPRNVYYTQKNPKETQSTSETNHEELLRVPDEFPIKRPQEIEIDCSMNYDDLEGEY